MTRSMAPASWTETTIRGCLADEFPGAWGSEPGRSGPNAHILRSTNLDDDGHITFATAAKRWVDEPHLTQRRLRDGDVLLEASGGGPGKPVGRVAHFHAPDSRVYLCSNFFRTLRPDETKLHSRFFAWRLLELYRQPGIWNFQQQTTGIINLKTKDYLQQSFRLPERPEQSRIAAVLDTVDQAIAETEAVIAKLRQVRAGIVDDLLTEANDMADHRPLSAVAFPRFSSVDKRTLPSEEPVRLCNYLDVYENAYVTAEMEFMHATATPSEIDEFRLQVGDVLITKDSESPDDIGIPCVIDSTAPDLLCGYHLALIRPNQSRVDPTYLALQLAHNRLAAYFGQQAVGSTRYGLSVAAIANAPILLPRIERQRKAAELIRLQDEEIREHEAVLRKHTFIKSGLMSDLLRGLVRVPETPRTRL